MDLSVLLPLLLGAKGGDKTKLLGLLGGKKPEDLLSGLSDNAQMGELIKMMQKKSRSGATGLSAISSFAPSDVVGALYKILNSV